MFNICDLPKNFSEEFTKENPLEPTKENRGEETYCCC